MVAAFPWIFLTFLLPYSFLMLILNSGTTWNVALYGRSTLLTSAPSKPGRNLSLNHLPKLSWPVTFLHSLARTSTSTFTCPWTNKCSQIRPTAQHILLGLSSLHQQLDINFLNNAFRKMIYFPENILHSNELSTRIN